MKGVEEDGELQGNTKAAKTTLIKPQVTVDYEPFVFNALMFVLCLQICSSFRMKPICSDEFKFWGKFFSEVVTGAPPWSQERGGGGCWPARA